MLNIILAVIGAFVVIGSIIGAVVPGWNFHLVFAKDEQALAFHEKLVRELKKGP